MRTNLFFSIVLIVCCFSKAATQSPYLKILHTEADLHELLKFSHVRATPDGNQLLCMTDMHRLTIIKMANDGQVLSSHFTPCPTLFSHRLYEAVELPGGDFLILFSYNTPGVVDRLFLMRLTPDFQEVWKTYLDFDEGDYDRAFSPIIISKSNHIYIQNVNFYEEDALVKLNMDGQILWTLHLKNRRISDIQELPNGNFAALASDYAFSQPKYELILISPDGALLKAVDIPAQATFELGPAMRSCVTPGGDILVAYYAPDFYSVFFQRLSPDLVVQEAWMIKGSGKKFNDINLVPVNDSLIYWSMTDLDHFILARMDQHGNVQKAALFPGIFHAQTIIPTGHRMGDTGWGMSALMADTTHIGIVYLDTTLTLPNCPLVDYHCFLRIPVQSDNHLTNLEILPFTFQDSLTATLHWQIAAASFEDFHSTYEAPDPYFSMPDSVCEGMTLQPTAIDTNAMTHRWSLQKNGVGIAQFKEKMPWMLFDSSGNWSVVHTMYDIGCNATTYTHNITVLPPPAFDLGPDSSICNRDSFVFSVHPTNATHWRWENQDTSLNRTVTTTGVYRLEAFNEACSVADAVALTFRKYSADFEAITGVCTGDLIQPEPLQSGPSIEHRWQWTPAVLPEGKGDAPAFQLADPGHYLLRHISGAENCFDTVEHPLRVFAHARVHLPAGLALCRDSTLQLFPDTAYITGFQWENGDTTLNRVVHGSGLFTIRVHNNFCADSATIRVLEHNCPKYHLYVPNVFAPNSGGADADFRVFHDATVEQVTLLQVYDRWGSLVFRSTDETGWDGTVGGKAVSPGVYIYYINAVLRAGGAVDLTGDVTVVR